jgi:hypothetical protein
MELQGSESALCTFLLRLSNSEYTKALGGTQPSEIPAQKKLTSHAVQCLEELSFSWVMRAFSDYGSGLSRYYHGYFKSNQACYIWESSKFDFKLSWNLVELCRELLLSWYEPAYVPKAKLLPQAEQFLLYLLTSELVITGQKQLLRIFHTYLYGSCRLNQLHFADPFLSDEALNLSLDLSNDDLVLLCLVPRILEKEVEILCDQLSSMGEMRVETVFTGLLGRIRYIAARREEIKDVYYLLFYIFSALYSHLEPELSAFETTISAEQWTATKRIDYHFKIAGMLEESSHLCLKLFRELKSKGFVDEDYAFCQSLLREYQLLESSCEKFRVHLDGYYQEIELLEYRRENESNLSDSSEGSSE